jgi:NAD(P)-dependent dehydrogenase (short-subunit alcohol dehydrogenase family)
MNRVAGKVAVITGGSLGIGRACAQRRGEEGATVSILDIREREGKAAVSEMQASGIRAAFFKVDITRERKIQKAFAQIEKDFGSIDVLVNNAGIPGVAKPTHEVSEKEWDVVNERGSPPYEQDGRSPVCTFTNQS